jgi:hypothetical protein
MNMARDKSEQQFEESLRLAMRRMDAPETLAEFLEAAADVQAEQLLPRKERKHRWSFFVPRPQFAGWMTAAVATMLAVGVLGGEQAYRHHERKVRATQQFETATRITDEALAHTREQLARAGVSLDQ